MKRYVEKQEETTNVLSNWVGVVLTDGIMGAILYIGDGSYHIICNGSSYRNIVCGDRDCDGSSVKDTLDKWKKASGSVAVKYIYCFDSFGELMQWFTDGIKE